MPNLRAEELTEPLSALSYYKCAVFTVVFVEHCRGLQWDHQIDAPATLTYPAAMSFPTLQPSSCMRSAAVRAAASLIIALLASQAALAAPEESGPDPVTRLLMEKGLLEHDASASSHSTPTPSETPDPIASFAKPPSPSLVQQLRDGASDMVLTAMNFLGVPYKRGGNSEETGFDCSGFTRYIFEKSIGLILPRRADDQAHVSSLITINREELKPGDLVFFNTLRRTFSHVGIYIGDGKFIHSPRTGSEVRVEDMRMSYWNKRFTGARRAPQISSSTNTTSPSPASMLPAAATPSSFLSSYTTEN